jgi:hypothetical protein
MSLFLSTRQMALTHHDRAGEKLQRESCGPHVGTGRLVLLLAADEYNDRILRSENQSAFASCLVKHLNCQ